MSNTLLVIVTLIYGGIALSSFFEGKPSMAIIFTGYAFANIGLLMADFK